MPIPSEINDLIERLNQELNKVEQESRVGLSLAQALLNRFPENARLIQLFASFNSAIFFSEIERRRIKSIIENFSGDNLATEEEIQEVGEDLASELGRVLETKMLISNLKQRLDNLP